MSFTVSGKGSIEDEVHRLAFHQIDKAIADIDDRKHDPHFRVHEVRKRCKKLRGLVRLARVPLKKCGYYADANARFRDIARGLSQLRDAEAMLETYDRLLEQQGGKVSRRRFSPIRQRLTQRRKAIAARVDLDARLIEARERLLEARSRVEDWSIPADRFSRTLGLGLAETYRRARVALAEVHHEPHHELIHEWRKHVKYHGYHLRMLKPLWPEALEYGISTLDSLGELLGEEHDLSELGLLLRDPVADFPEGRHIEDFQKLMLARRREIHAEALPLGDRLFAERPQDLARRFDRYWSAWHGEVARKREARLYKPEQETPIAVTAPPPSGEPHPQEEAATVAASEQRPALRVVAGGAS